MPEAEEGMRGLTGSFTTGNTQLNSRNYEEKVIQLLILFHRLQAPPRFARARLAFKKPTAAAIAAIFHQHLGGFRDNKINTLQLKVGDQIDRI
jgi:hypothetical protein